MPKYVKGNINLVAAAWEGIGDLMYYLNTAHLMSSRKQCDVTIHFMWETRSSYKAHPQDNRSVVDLIEYIHKLYDTSESTVVIKHYHKDDFTRRQWYITERHFENNKLLLLWDNTGYTKLPDPNDNISSYWPMDKSHLPKVKPNKIVYWNHRYNNTIRLQGDEWKYPLSLDDWDIAINKLKELGYEVVEVAYRAPIEEVIHNIATAELVIGHDGMWHRITTNLLKPTILVTDGIKGVVNTFNGHHINNIDSLMELIYNPDFIHIVKETNNNAIDRVNKAIDNHIDWTITNPLVNKEYLNYYANRQSSN
jgi:hypothetical protein